MYSAIADEPTKPIALMCSSVSSVSTASLSPLTTLRMPSGSPASKNSSAIRIGTDGSRSDGLRLQALPQESAGELHLFQATLDGAFGVRKGLAGLGGGELGEIVVFLLHQREELEHHAGAPL